MENLTIQLQKYWKSDDKIRQVEINDIYKIITNFKRNLITKKGGVYIETLEVTENQCPNCLKRYTMLNNNSVLAKEQILTGICSKKCWKEFLKSEY
jgi:hypothetical protein